MLTNVLPFVPSATQVLEMRLVEATKRMHASGRALAEAAAAVKEQGLFLLLDQERKRVVHMNDQHEVSELKKSLGICR